MLNNFKKRECNINIKMTPSGTQYLDFEMSVDGDQFDFSPASTVGVQFGAIVSALGAGLPSFIAILVFAMFLNQFQDNEYVARAFRAIRPAVIALIAVPVFKLAKTAKITLKTIWIPILVALLIWLLGVSPIWIILTAIVSGLAIIILKDKKDKNIKN